MEKEAVPQFTVEEMSLADIDDATAMRLESWLETYTNDELGVTRDWINERNKVQQSEEKVASRKARFMDGKKNGLFNGWVARNEQGEVIGSTTPFIDEDGIQHLGSLYVDKKWHGKGVANQLMQKVVDWLDPEKPIELEVVSYNEHAKAFYRKWGFEEVPDSETLFADKIPEVKMIRKGDNQ